MESLEQIIQKLFGGALTFDKVLDVIIAIGSIVFLIAYKFIQLKLKKVLASSDHKDTEIERLKKIVGNQTTIITTAFLASKNLDPTAKAEIIKALEKTKKLQDVDLGVVTAAIVKKLTSPEEEPLEVKTEKIKEEAKATQETIEEISAKTSSLADELLLRSYDEK